MAEKKIRVKSMNLRGSESQVTRQEYNKAYLKLRELCTMLDADAGVTGTNYLATFDGADGPAAVVVNAVNFL